MNFNQEYINQLAEGKAILEHTMLPVDLPMLIEILKAAKICNVEPFGNSQYYYLGQVCTWASTTILLNPDNLPIIPLHDFVSPTKEEKQTIESIDARLKELSEKYAELETMVRTTRVPYPTYEEVQIQSDNAIKDKRLQDVIAKLKEKKAAKEEQPKEVLPQAKEEILVEIVEQDNRGGYSILITKRFEGFTPEQSVQYQAIIKNALNGTN